jgi:mono/diheme cytochrome c family protein
MSKPTILQVALLGLASTCVVSALPAFGQDVSDLQARLERLQQAVAGITQQHESLELADGREIYKTACMPCHGIEGDGQGPAAKWLEPRARDFRQGLFKWRTTPFGALPTDEDLERTIRVGVSGTEMFPFGDLLSKRSRLAVARYIKVFSPKFVDPALQPAPADVIEIPETRPFERSEASINQGKALFAAKGCVICHGNEGRGDGPAAKSLVDASGTAIEPWDFARGYFKSGHTDQDLYRTITTGLNGTPMVSYMDLTTPEERWQLVDYIRSVAGSRPAFIQYLFIDEPGGRVYGD